MTAITLADVIAYATANLAADDYCVSCEADNFAEFTFDDFIGFDDDWCEEYRDFTDEEAIDNFLAYLDEHAISAPSRCGMYPEWTFDGFVIRIAYTSYDI